MRATATLTRWGNSQGIRIPREACGLLGIDVGAHAEVSVDPSESTMTLRFERTSPERHYARTRRMTLEDIVRERGGAWDGTKAGGEAIVGEVGAEVVA